MFPSILFGVVVGFSIGYVMHGEHNAHYHGPNSNIIKSNIYYHQKNGKCYKFDTIPYVCAPSKTTSKN